MFLIFYNLHTQNIIKEETNTEQKNNIVNINKAGLEELMSLQGIGESTAWKIIEYRALNGKYKNIRLDETSGMIVEIENGNYISAKNLSVGTIDELYLSLRLGAGLEISSETLPIILDETFAYWDDIRLQNILMYLNEEFKNRQIILLTCTNREEEVLKKLCIKYNKIKL